MSDAASSSTSPKLCGICEKNPSKYCCPRCEIYYCSVICYKSESHTDCSESFYKDCVTEELALHQNDDESKNSMMDILRRLQNDELDPNEFDDLVESMNQHAVDSDDDEVLDLHERVKHINLDNADALWNILTQDEKNDFAAFVSEGDVESVVPQWEPWWMYSKDVKLVEDVNEINIKDEEEALKKCPAFKEVQKLSSLTSVKPSVEIRYNIASVVASYVFVARYLNGEFDPVEASTYLLNICANLDANMNFQNIPTALESVAQRCFQSDLIQTDQHGIELMKYDTFRILQGPSTEKRIYYCKAALSHVHSLLSEAKAIKSPKKEKVERKKENGGDKKENGEGKNENGEDKKQNDGDKNRNGGDQKKNGEDKKAKSEFSKKFPEPNTEYSSKLDISKVKKCIKKIEYYLSYIQDYSIEAK